MLARTFKFIEQFSREMVIQKKEGYLLCTKRQCKANMRFVQGYSKKQAKEKLAKALADKSTFITKENGKTVIGVRQATLVQKSDGIRNSHNFKGDAYQVGAGAAQSLLQGPGPGVDQEAMLALTGSAKLFGNAPQQPSRSGAEVVNVSNSERESDDGDEGEESEKESSDDDDDDDDSSGSAPRKSPEPTHSRRGGRKATPSQGGDVGGGRGDRVPRRRLSKKGSGASRSSLDEIGGVSVIKDGKLNPQEFLKEVGRFAKDLKVVLEMRKE